MGRGVERLHGGMREKWDFVDGVDLFRCATETGGDIAVLTRLCAWLESAIGERPADSGAGEGGVGAFVPLHRERFGALNGGPCIVGNNGDAARDLDCALVAGDS